jgi:hypothetical protein
VIEYVAVVGSREYPDEERVRVFVRSLPSDSVLISGGARGVDSWAEDEARRHGMIVHVYPADWKRYGRRAGFIRNVDIVRSANRVVAFWDGRSPGTKSTIDIAERESKPCEVVLP